MKIRELFSEIFKYLRKKNNYIALILYVLTIIIGATNPFGVFRTQLPLHKSWIVASFLFTIGYTLYFHYAGFRHGYFENFGGIKTASLILTNILLIIIYLFIANELFNVFRYTPNIKFALALMAFSFFTYSIMNWTIHMHFIDEKNIKNKRAKGATGDEKKKFIKSAKHFQNLANDFKYSVFTSDLPITISFLFLFLYSLSLDTIVKIHNVSDIEILNNGFEYFFSGAIAFQIMYSNAIWIFTDDKFFKKLT